MTRNKIKHQIENLSYKFLYFCVGLFVIFVIIFLFVYNNPKNDVLNTNQNSSSYTIGASNNADSNSSNISSETAPSTPATPTTPVSPVIQPKETKPTTPTVSPTAPKQEPSKEVAKPETKPETKPEVKATDADDLSAKFPSNPFNQQYANAPIEVINIVKGKNVISLVTAKGFKKGDIYAMLNENKMIERNNEGDKMYIRYDRETKSILNLAYYKKDGTFKGQYVRNPGANTYTFLQ